MYIKLSMTDIVETKIKKYKIKDVEFQQQQKDIFEKLTNILNLKVDDNTSFLRKDELDKKKDDIIALYDDVRKYYNATVWRSIEASLNEDSKYMCIIRRVLIHHGYEFKYKKKQKIENKQVLSFAIYYITTKTKV